jgi:hypothetical protein
VLIEQIVFKLDKDQKTGADTAFIEIMGTAYSTLKDPWNPSAGTDDLLAPVPVKDQVKVLVVEGKNDDNNILFDQINRQFELKKPLEDTPDAWERFTKDGTDSVYDEIIGKPAFFVAKKSQTKDGTKLGDYFFNMRAVAKRVEATMDNVKDKLAAMFARRKAKKDAAESMGSDDVPAF